MDDRLELMPVRQGMLVSAWAEILAHAGGLAVLTPFYRRHSLSFLLVLTGVWAAAVGLLGWVGWRFALRRVVAPPPPNATIVPAHFPVRDVVWSVARAFLFFVAGLVHWLTPAFLGGGVGSGVAKLWSVRKIGEFERTDGRRVLSIARRSWRIGARADLYADNGRAGPRTEPSPPRR